MERLSWLFAHGGAAMALIAAGSVLSVALGIERFWWISRHRRAAAALHARVMERVRAGDLAGARTAAEAGGDEAAPYRAALEAATAGNASGGAADRARRRTLAALRQGLWLQGTLGATMPFIGLYGTVVGVLGAFDDIRRASASGFQVVAGSISEALVTTAAGIAVAVEAVVLYNVFNAMAASAALDLNLRVEELVEALEAVREADGNGSRAAGSGR